ncbi:hypothetical protein GW17_00032068 [Ensete ventricosum]|nr:hypothetical protein GW17_00032068 [Ensete ventricosum]
MAGDQGNCSVQGIGESSDSTIELNVKMLDSRVYTFHVGDFELYRPVWVVRIDPPVDRYVDRRLSGGTTDWGCFRPIITQNRSVIVDFDHRWPVSDVISRGKEKEEEGKEKPGVRYCSSLALSVAYG